MRNGGLTHLKTRFICREGLRMPSIPAEDLPTLAIADVNNVEP